MNIVHVIPIARGITRETLSYWSKDDVSPGSLVVVPLRSRTTPALVVRTEPVAAVKADVRSAQFALRKLADTAPIPLLSPAFMRAAAATATFHAATTGAVLFSLLPKILLENLDQFTQLNPPDASSERHTSEALIFQAPDAERVIRYRSLIRECFADRRSVFIAVPTIADAEYLSSELERGIENYTLLLHSAISSKKLLSRMKAVREETHPVLIVATPGFITLERADLDTIVIDREASRSYKTQGRPYLDTRYFLEAYGHERKLRVLCCGLPLRAETIYRYETHELGALTQPLMRLTQAAPHAVIDRRELNKENPKPFEIVGPEMRAMLEHAGSHGERSLLFVARRGLSPLIVCQDCGSLVRGTLSDTPMTLHSSPEGNIFVSHDTGEVRSAQETCRVCSSWRLHALGIGSEGTAAEVEALFPGRSVIRVDQDAAPTHSRIKASLTRFYETPQAVLVATERALPYLHDAIENVGVVSIDSLLSLPEWKVAERTFALLLKLRQLATMSLLIQTRKNDQSIIDFALRGTLDEFIESELAIRKSLHYPPFSTLIHLRIVGAADAAAKALLAAVSHLESWGPEPYPAPVRVGENRYAVHALIRVPRVQWPDTELLARLASLPPHVSVEINPEQLL